MVPQLVGSPLESLSPDRDTGKHSGETSADASRNEKGQVQPVSQLVGSPVESQSPDGNTDRHASRTSAIRAKAAHTNREYIDMTGTYLRDPALRPDDS